MPKPTGLRERKKLRTRQVISEAAISLFLRHGFDQVSITQVAETAEISRRTLFAYFPTKEDLVVQRFADHEAEGGRVVRERGAAESPLDALRAYFLDGLRRHDPITGLTDEPSVLAFYQLLINTPALAVRMLEFREKSEQFLAEALRDHEKLPALTAQLAAAQIIAVHWTLALGNYRRAAEGMSADTAYPAAMADAEAGFAMLANGLPASLR